jgi:glycosyltransferase involved in cell wall biosynthesis
MVREHSEMTERAPLALFLPTLEEGGAERVVVNLAGGLAARGFRTDLVLAQAEGPYLTQVPAGVRVVDLKAPRVLLSLGPLTKYLERERPVAVLAGLDHANLVAMAAARGASVRPRVVISIHNTISRSLQDASGLKERAIPWLLGRLHRWADSIVAVSAGVADDFARVTHVPRGRIQVIFNPVITPALWQAVAEPPPHPWFADPSPPIVLGVGRLRRQKNFPALIDAFAEVRRTREARLVILGEGPDRAALESLIRARGLQDSVAMPGFLDNPYACMARAAVFVLSSDWEGLPTVLIESLAVGTPVVSTDCESGPREILRDGALGELVPVGDVRALARSISKVLAAARAVPPVEMLRPFTLDTVLDDFQRVLGLCA